MPSHLANTCAKRAYRREVDQPTVLWFDPGETVGWSAMTCDKAKLADPNLSAHEAIVSWHHGQIVADPIEKQSSELASEIQRNHRELSRRVGNGMTVDFTSEYWAAEQMFQLVEDFPGCAVGLESFTVRRYDQSRSFLSPVRITSAFEMLCWQAGILVFRQSPADAKTVATDDRLKRWKLYKREGGEQHARDADRHGITFLRGCKDIVRGKARRELAWPHIYG